MNKLEIYNMALDALNIQPLTETDLSNGTDPVVITLNRWFADSLRKASREEPWSFLIEKIKLEGDSLGEGMGRKYSYTLPESILRTIFVDGGDYQRANSIIYTNTENPNIYCIRLEKTKKGYNFGEIDEDYIPSDFWELVAYALALKSSLRLSSGDNKFQYIASMYNTVLNAMRQNDYAFEVKDINELG